MRSQSDVPLPTIQYLCEPNSTKEQLQAASIFTALVGLTSVLNESLEHVYNIKEQKYNDASRIESALQQWVDSLIGVPQRIILDGTDLEAPAGANLRLAYLSMNLLLQRIKLDAAKQQPMPLKEKILEIYLQGRQTAEEILTFTQSLQSAQLNDFWLGVSAFAYPTTVNFLLRHALETEISAASLAQTESFQLARQLIDILRLHKENHRWDMGDVCLAEHAELVDKVVANLTSESNTVDIIFDLEEFVMPDASILDEFFPSLWDPLQNVW